MDRIRAMGKAMLADSNASIDEDVAIHIVQVALHSMKHPDHVRQLFIFKENVTRKCSYLDGRR